MIYELAGLKFNIEFFRTVENNKPYLLFLHGFTGSANDWMHIIPDINQNFSCFGIDLIGHGKSSSPNNTDLYSAESISNQISAIISHTVKRKIIPVGYSMGGRAALNFAIKYPDMIDALILESTTPGIQDQKQREDRINRDEEIAGYIETHSMEEFAEYWMDMEIFNTQRRFSEEKRKQLRRTRINNNHTGLINSLRGFGTGKMPPLFDKLNTIKCKTLLITGELDTKFTDINSEMIKLFPNAVHKIIKNAGHNTHMEEPKRFIEALNTFLQEF